jgi:hypothetical protein
VDGTKVVLQLLIVDTALVGESTQEVLDMMVVDEANKSIFEHKVLIFVPQLAVLST